MTALVRLSLLLLLGGALVCSAADDDDDDGSGHVHDKTHIGNAIGGAVGGVGILVWICLLAVVLSLACCVKVRCAPSGVVAQHLRYLSNGMKIATYLVVIVALAATSWFRYVNYDASSSEVGYGMFQYCGACFDVTVPDPFYVSKEVGIIPLGRSNNDTRKACAALLFVTLFACMASLVLRCVSIGAMQLKMRSLIVVLETVSAISCMLSWTLYASMFSSATGQSKSAPNSPASDGINEHSKLDFSWACALLASFFALIVAILGCVRKGNVAAIVLTLLNLVLVLTALSSTRWAVYKEPRQPGQTDVTQTYRQLGLFEYCSNCVYYDDMHDRTVETNGMLDSFHNGERNGAVTFTFFAMLTMLLVLLLALLQAMRVGLYKAELGKCAKALQPLLLMIVALFLLFVMSLMGGLYGDILSHYHKGDPKDGSGGPTIWFFTVGMSFGFVIWAWFMAVAAAFIDVIVAGSEATDDGSAGTVNKSEYTPIISDPQPVAAKTDSYGSLPF